MPLFKKQPDKEHKKILQKKLVLAQEKPDNIFDLAECGIYEVPEGVFSKCKFLNKGALLLQHNFLTDLKHGGDIADLAELRILDLSFNRITVLPKTISHLTKLQKLDLSNNKLKKLPDEIGNLRDLQFLNLKENALTGLPSTIKTLQQLQTLDISDNKYLTNLPASLCYLRSLETFHFDLSRITYPSKETTSKGLNEIQRFFKLLKGDEFLEESCSPNSNSTPSTMSPMSHGSRDDIDNGAAFEAAIIQRELEKERINRERLALEGQILDAQTENARLVAGAHQKRQEVLTQVAYNEQLEQSELARQYAESNQNRNKLLEQLYLEENHLDETVNLVLQMSAKSRHTEELLEELEREQSKIDKLVQVTQEEAERLRKEEVLKSMNYLLSEMQKSEETWNKYEASKEQIWKQALRNTAEEDHQLSVMLHSKDDAQREMLNQIMTEEDKQKKAFQFLQVQKDWKLNRIRKQIDMIEAELAKLSILEMEKRKEKEDREMNQLAEMRVNTAIMLTQLIDEQEKREQDLRNTMESMEKERLTQAEDYWLIQYQRLLDNKPRILIDAENHLDVFVVEVVLHAGGREFLPMFARHNVDHEAMATIDDEKLREIGVNNPEVRSRILSARDKQLHFEIKVDKATPSTPSMDTTEDPLAKATAPAASAPTAFGVGGECVICMDNAPDVILLNCGHVCCCNNCCLPLELCPICRQTIVQKCRLYGT